ncbi:formylglycine-generating enzyme family protein [Zhouia sp. PK063]|uniref:formylglycine-generating enzyme family protein n=1 Tax=Zhouia sp. PK063 TaxID=3373602 RepID=UPI003791D9AD
MKTRIVVLLWAVFPTFVFSQTVDYPELITVPGGEFTRGEVYDQPTQRVKVDTFQIAKTETTVAQWKAFCLDTHRNLPDPPPWGWHNNDPVVNVSYQDAQDYCKWLSLKKAAVYRLPTEAEWELAARGGMHSKGTMFSGSQKLDTVAWYGNNSNGKVHAVAQKLPNELGLYDMSGNVWEWCLDYYGEDYFPNQVKVNPTGPPTGSFRIVRGGGWNSQDKSFCRVTKRYLNAPENKDEFNGFRVVRVWP